MPVATHIYGSSDLTIISRPGQVHVEDFATAGDGSLANPFTGWDTPGAIVWQANKEYHWGIPCARYRTAAWPVPPINNLRLFGHGAILDYIGGPATPENPGAMFFIGPTIGANGCKLVVEDFVIDGGETGIENSSVDTGTVGAYFYFCNHSFISNIIVKNAATAFRVSNTVCNLYQQLICSSNLVGGDPDNDPVVSLRHPVRSLVVDGLASANVFIEPIFDTFYTVGIDLVTAQSNRFIGGTSEGGDFVGNDSLGIGVRTAAHSQSETNSFLGIDLEVNKVNKVNDGGAIFDIHVNV